MHRTWHRGITTAGSFRAQAEAIILCQNLNTPCQKTALPPDISDAWTGAFCRCDWQEMKSFKKCDHIATSFRAQAEAMILCDNLLIDKETGQKNAFCDNFATWSKFMRLYL